MKWSSMSAKLYENLLLTAVSDGREILKNCCTLPSQKIEKIFDKMIREAEYLAIAEGKELAFQSSNTRELIDDLYSEYRIMIMKMVKETMLPYDAEKLLDYDIAQRETMHLIDMDISGIYAFADNGMIRIRTPLLPHKDKPEVYFATGKTKKRYKITNANIYGEALHRVLIARTNELESTFESLNKKTIHNLTIFSDPTNVMDNDNRDTHDITNTICTFTPNGDAAPYTRFMFDGMMSTLIPEGTYITILPYENKCADNEITVEFWQKKLAEVGYIAPCLC